MEARGLTVRTAQEPGGTPLGEAIRGVFLDPRWKKLDGRVEALLDEGRDLRARLLEGRRLFMDGTAP